MRKQGKTKVFYSTIHSYASFLLALLTDNSTVNKERENSEGGQYPFRIDVLFSVFRVCFVLRG
jgi:hypothetical protein